MACSIPGERRFARSTGFFAILPAKGEAQSLSSFEPVLKHPSRMLACV